MADVEVSRWHSMLYRKPLNSGRNRDVEIVRAGSNPVKPHQFMKSEIGECVSVLFYKRWGKTPVGNKLRSRAWWENRLKDLINTPAVAINCDWEPGIYNEDGTLQELPIPYEKEFGL